MDMMMRCAVAFVSQSHEPSFVQTIFVEKQKKRPQASASWYFCWRAVFANSTELYYVLHKIEKELTHQYTIRNHLMWDLLIISTQSLYDIYSHLKLYTTIFFYFGWMIFMLLLYGMYCDANNARDCLENTLYILHDIVV
jgi:hypothetical protein